MLFLVFVTIFVVLACVVVPGLTFVLVLLVDDEELAAPAQPARLDSTPAPQPVIVSEGRGTQAAPSRPSLARRRLLSWIVRSGLKLALLPSNQATGVR